MIFGSRISRRVFGASASALLAVDLAPKSAAAEEKDTFQLNYLLASCMYGYQSRLTRTLGGCGRLEYVALRAGSGDDRGLRFRVSNASFMERPPCPKVFTMLI